MDLAARAEEISTHRINKDEEQPPDALIEIVSSVDAYACMSDMYAYIMCALFVWGNNLIGFQ